MRRIGRRTMGKAALSLLVLMASLGSLLVVGELGASAVTTLTVTSNANAGPGTLRQAVIDASTGGSAAGSDVTIVIQSGLAPIVLSSSLDYDGGTSGSKNLVLQGNGATITGNDTFRLLSALGTGTVAIDAVTMSHGSESSGGGGALRTGGVTTISNSNFHHNHNGYWGGAVVSFPASGGTMTVSNSTFDTNDSGFGGGAMLSNYNIVVTDSVFTANSGDSGGAISASGTVDVTGSTFTGNTARAGSGGAIEANAGGSATTSTFTNNSAGSSGGGAYFPGPFAITSSSFLGNHSAGSGGGAALFGLGSIVDSTFDSNDAVTAGGGIHYAAAPNVLEVTGTTISNNHVSNGNGGGMQVESGLHLVNSTVTGNRASGVSGAIHSYSWYDPQYPQYATQPYTITVDFSTVADNGASTAGNFGTDAPQVVTLVVNGSVISDSRTAGGASGGANCLLSPAATATSSVASDSSCFATGGTNLVTSISSIGLGALANNSGPTKTMLPGSSSVLIAFVTNSPAPSVVVDQRGVSRTAPMTAGAVEVDPFAPSPTTTIADPGDVVAPAFAG